MKKWEKCGGDSIRGHFKVVDSHPIGTCVLLTLTIIIINIIIDSIPLLLLLLLLQQRIIIIVINIADTIIIL